MSIERDPALENPFHDSLTILARIISRAYRRNLIFANQYIASDGLQTYASYACAPNYFEWHFTSEDGAPYVITTTLPQ